MDPYSWWVKNSPGTAIRESRKEGLSWVPGCGWAICGEDWQPGRGRGGGLLGGAPAGPAISPPASQFRGHTSSPCTGARSEAAFPFPAWIWPGHASALCQWTQERLGWPEIFSAHSWPMRETIELDQLLVMGQGPGPVLSQSSALGHDPRHCCVFLDLTRAADSPQTMAHQGSYPVCKRNSRCARLRVPSPQTQSLEIPVY